MSSGFIRHLLQSIKKKKDGVAVLPLCIVVIGFLMLLSNFMYRRQLVQINYENIDTALTDSLLAGAIINYSEFGRTGKVMIQDGDEPSVWDSCFDNSYRLFTEWMKAIMQ